MNLTEAGVYITMTLTNWTQLVQSIDYFQGLSYLKYLPIQSKSFPGSCTYSRLQKYVSLWHLSKLTK